MSVTPLASALGARVVGIDLASASDSELDSVEDLLTEHLVLAFPDQQLTPSRHVEIGARFGEPLIHPFLEAVPEHPAILQVLKEPDQHETFGGEFWHSDITFLDPPAAVSVLYGIEIPELGGDTLFANQYLAYETLTSAMRGLLDGLTATHLYPDMAETSSTSAVHPVVRVHPTSGRRALFVNGAFVHRINELARAESNALLEFLFQHQVRPEFQVRVEWSPGQVLLWDNRATLHYAVNDHHGTRRRLERVTAMERVLR